ncbi:putative fusion protein with hemerythrin HHE cation binding domain [Desulforapulum autotrophicum HRM2]|uniref:Fusion protein with hemerythrin HHE cation binding domain n=1 Tax=Desulforapulum autotrophicum (strain ATCC 43914 / DSM 3382 / VKM B-1955 / HRM2) TaxID=177437 RepID=C0QE79_DESAH|nr:hemerythrin domain-containing protein [Desulforapulum autotrophicum]ACN13196.1 putative fusion protein with hemerythrin HHE cation binding domain [Desulforapulum autotrophicum HRM2]
MDVLSRLTQEHAHILQGINYLEKARDLLEQNRQPSVDFFKTAVLFFEEYADQLHHYKEEYLLFSVLASKKGGRIDLGIGSLRYQHELNRRCIKKIEDSLTGYEKCGEIATTTLLENLAVYISILKRHIFIENRLFYPMAETELSEDEKRELKNQFDEEEAGYNTRQMISDNLSRLQKMKELIFEIKKS